MGGRPEVELYLFTNNESARRAGFGVGGQHPRSPALVAWWPSRRYDAIRGLRFSRVTVVHDHHQMTDQERVEREHTLELAQVMLIVDPMIWMELG